jgi:hypothetical protein
MKRRFLLLIVAVGAFGYLMQPASAQNAHGNHDAYMFVVGAPPVEGPDVSTAPNGSTVTLTGTGSFQAGPDKTASGGGTYSIGDSAGNMIAAGAWTAMAVLGFVDYGTEEDLPASFHGGEAQVRISLSGVGEGVLTIACLVGSPPAGKDEGIRLVLGQGLNFSQSTSGQTLFIKP